MFNILTVSKGLASAATSLGVGTVVGNAIKATTPYNITTTHKVIVGIGGLALTGLVGELASRRAEEKIDELIEPLGYPKDAEVEEDTKEN